MNKRTVVNITISDDAEIAKLNKEYFDRDFPTDVLSFNIDQVLEDGNFYLGDIMINKDQAGRQASEYGNTLEQEISELVAHGMLHLLGVHHEGDDEHSVHGV